MNKKGFTLIELLAVIVILGIIAIVATVSMFAIIDSSNYELFDSKKEVVLVAAELYGQDNRASIPDSGKKITVGDLIENDYLEIKDVCVDSSSAEYTCMKNDVTDVDMKDDIVYIYIENNRVYAKFEDSIKSCAGTTNNNCDN